MTRSELVRFIEENLLHGTNQSVGPDDSLIDLGLLDSIGLMQMMQFIEDRTGLRIPDHMVTPDNFQTVAAIEQMVAGLGGPARTA
jgi:acyl carrier protein